MTQKDTNHDIFHAVIGVFFMSVKKNPRLKSKPDNPKLELDMSE